MGLWEPFLFKLSQILRYVQRVNILHWEWRILITEGIMASSMNLSSTPNSCSLGSPWIYYISKGDLYLLILLPLLPECISCSGSNWGIKISVIHVLGKRSASWATSPASQIFFEWGSPYFVRSLEPSIFLYSTTLWSEAEQKHVRSTCMRPKKLRKKKNSQETPDRKWRHSLVLLGKEGIMKTSQIMK